jgi:succinyl-CoA synthetase beta subunit
VDLFEYQARDVFAKHGVPVLDAAVAQTPEEARAAAERLIPASASGKVVVKAQVKTGGRGKAGGVKLADSPDDAAEKAGQILGMDIKGHTVHRVMIAPARTSRRSTTSPCCSTVQPHLPRDGQRPRGHGHRAARVERPGGQGASTRSPGSTRQARRSSSGRRLPPTCATGRRCVQLLWRFRAEDATLSRSTRWSPVTAVMRSTQGHPRRERRFRHPTTRRSRRGAADPLEAKAKAKDLNYVKLDGQVGIIGNGAGLGDEHPRRRRATRARSSAR